MPYKRAVERCASGHDGEQPDSNAEAGIGPQPAVPGVSSVDIGEGGSISIEFSGSALRGKSLLLQPEPGDGPLRWSCFSLTIPAKQLPPECR